MQALRDELDRCGPAMLRTDVPELAGEPARRLCGLAGGGLNKTYFGSSGSEALQVVRRGIKI